LRVSYPRAKGTPELIIPLLAIKDVTHESCNYGFNFKLSIHDTDVARQVQTNIKSHFGSGFWIGGPWFEGLHIASDTEIGLSQLIQSWCDFATSRQ
jgi:hypothetical protein